MGRISDRSPPYVHTMVHQTNTPISLVSSARSAKGFLSSQNLGSAASRHDGGQQPRGIPGFMLPCPIVQNACLGNWRTWADFNGARLARFVNPSR
jgi:hypothetical protein